MKILKAPAALLAVAVLAMACSDGTAPVDVRDPGTPSFHHMGGGWSQAILHSGPGPSGNPSCTSLGYQLGFKIDQSDLPAGVSNHYGLFTVTRGTINDGTFDIDAITSWSSLVPVAALLVKGGPHAYEYKYVPSSLGDPASNAHSPFNAQSGNYPGISHIEFCVNPELAISKDAETTFDRTWTWDIEKDLDVDIPFEFGEGDLLSVDYTVLVSATSVDSDWAVSGTITIENPAAFGLAATITGVTDVISKLGEADIDADVDCGVTFPYVLASGGTLECTYDADLPDADTRLNTATVTTSGPVAGGTATADVEFGDDPTNEIDACIDVNDVLEINGVEVLDEDLGTVCAPDHLDANGEYEFLYTRTFGAGGDFALECDNNTVDNVASFITNDTGTTGEDDAGFEIFVICEVGEDQTAWAANGHEPGQLPYNPGDTGNWATYVQYDGVEKCTTLFAGQTDAVGTVCFSDPVGGVVTISITLDAGVSFADDSVVAVQDYAEAPSGNPAPGSFDHKAPAIAPFSIDVPENNFYGVHAVVNY
jgi:hypothetical protein